MSDLPYGIPSTGPQRIRINTASNALEYTVNDGVTWTAVTGGGGPVPSGTGFRHVTGGTEDGATVPLYYPKAGTALTDASATISPGTDKASQYLAAVAETANRTTTMDALGTPLTGQQVAIVRTSAAAFTRAIVDGPSSATLFTFPASQTASIRAVFMFNGANWQFGGAEYVVS